MSELDVTLRDGRTLHVYDEGDPNGKVVLEHHGTPGSGISFPPDLQLARERGVRIVSYDRAGYGGSTPDLGRSVADVAADIEDVLDELGIDRFASLGGSGGCPHSFACGALLAGRCVAAGAIASPAPWGAEELDWLAGQGEQNIEEWDAALAGGHTLERYLEPVAAEIRAATAEQIREVMSTLLPPVDREVLTGERAAHAKRNLDRALEPGIAGWRDDDLAFIAAWGFDLAAIAVPTLLWQGVQDKMVPLAHAEWLAARIPGVETHTSEEDGHLSIAATKLGGIYDWLAARF
jgi:pimeloyl-ACP methyl ester carboxylesterase